MVKGVVETPPQSSCIFFLFKDFYHVCKGFIKTKHPRNITTKRTNIRIIKYRRRRRRHSGQNTINKAIEENILNLNESLVKVKGAYRV